MPAWPNNLPCLPIANSLNLTVEPNTVEFKPDVGRPQRSRRYTLTRRPYDFQMAMTSEQVRFLLDTFFADLCNDGVSSFTCRDFADVTDAPPTKTFTWAEPPQVQQISPNRYRVAMSWVRED